MTTTKPIQLRGHCQCCGRQHAVLRGRIAKHGYEVVGYFRGVCHGADTLPMQVERKLTDRIIKDQRENAAAARQQAADLKAGKVRPQIVERSYRRDVDDTVIAWDDAKEWQRQEAVRVAIHQAEHADRTLTDMADALEALADRVHGQPLIEAQKPAAPEPIKVGERRTGARGVLTVKTIDRGSVWWTTESGLKGRTSTRSWRLLPLVAAAPATTTEHSS